MVVLSMRPLLLVSVEPKLTSAGGLKVWPDGPRSAVITVRVVATLSSLTPRVMEMVVGLLSHPGATVIETLPSGELTVPPPLPMLVPPGLTLVAAVLLIERAHVAGIAFAVAVGVELIGVGFGGAVFADYLRARHPA